jgi:hypothetical protein
MQNLQYLLKSVNLLNLLLLAVAITAIACAVVPLADISVNVTPPAPTETGTGQPEQPSAGSQAPAYADYASIAEQNVFHPLRRIPPENKGDLAVPKPEVILYGTLITDDVKIAYVEDKKSPRTSPGRGKRQIALKKGDTLSGYVLKEVEKDRIELVKGNDRIVVFLSDQNKVRNGEAKRPGASPGGPQMAAPPMGPSAVPARTMPAAPGTRTAPRQ